MYQRSTSIASVSYGASATAVEASGIWPRQWPEKLVAALSPFALKKKEYKKSFVLQEFHSPLAPQVNEMTTAFLKVIQEFLVLQDALVHQTKFDHLALIAHLDWIKKSGKYNFRMGSTPGALRLSAQVVGACYLLLHGDDGEAVPGLFSIKDPAAGPQVCSADDLKKLGYPTEPTQPSYLVYDIEPAVDFADYTCNYAALQGKPASAALGHPFATPLIDILIARKPKIP